MTYKKIVAGLLMAAVLVSPTLSFAKDNHGNKGSNKEKNCLRAIGHSFAPGWFKKSGERGSFKENCKIPFGIWKKHNGGNGNGTTTPDTVAPVMTDLSVSAGVNRAVITWETNEKADSTVFYGTNATVDTSATAQAARDNDDEKEHRIVLTNLAASTTYYAVVRSVDASGNVTTSDRITFTTKSSLADVTAPLINDIVVMAERATTTVTFTTSELAKAKIYYSTVSGFALNGNGVSVVGDSTLRSNHSLDLTGLSADTVYYLKIEAEDASGNVKTSGQIAFRTDD